LNPYHAATSLQEGAVLITNDRHFDRINAEKIIEVWSIRLWDKIVQGSVNYAFTDYNVNPSSKIFSGHISFG
jgi:hypothetical protein